MAQVRIDTDVAEALARAADRHDSSVAKEANATLRRALGLPAAGPKATRVRVIDPTKGFTAKASAPRGPRMAQGGACTHPVSRRLGDRCGQCGAKVRRAG